MLRRLDGRVAVRELREPELLPLVACDVCNTGRALMPAVLYLATSEYFAPVLIAKTNRPAPKCCMEYVFDSHNTVTIQLNQHLVCRVTLLPRSAFYGAPRAGSARKHLPDQRAPLTRGCRHRSGAGGRGGRAAPRAGARCAR